ncbi:polysaccharide biosynthesis protein, partial [Candidatus Marithrix sp. Canyon 246]
AFIGSLSIALVLVLFNRLALIPRSSLLFYPFLLIIFLGLPRLIFRVLNEHSFNFLLTDQAHPKRVLILGAGTSGDMLVRDMLRIRGNEYMPLAFLDDNSRLHGGNVQGVPVLGNFDQLVETIETMQIDLIIIAMPSASDEQMRRVVDLCKGCELPVMTLPKLDQLVNRQVNFGALHDIAIDDLLGRAKIKLDWNIISLGLHKKVVMISGGGGSIGSELCQQVAGLNPTALIIFERCEYNLYKIELQLREEFPDLVLYAHLGDIVDSVAIRHILAKYKPEVIFHAAAYKHVPMLQSQAREAVRNNILGTQALVEAAVEYACKTFVMVSTDKAVNPTNIMGATKRAAEILCQTMNENSNTSFITVRFGNVLGSAGSVVPLFKQQIAKGGPVTVTHPEINRYFMTIPEACQLILQASAMGQGGEIFVLDMGKPIKISYLAEQMVRLSGKIPEQDIKIIYTGLRPGEKLHEELFYTDEKLAATNHPKILLAAHRHNDIEIVMTNLRQLTEDCNDYNQQNIIKGVKQIVPELQI